MKIIRAAMAKRQQQAKKQQAEFETAQGGKAALQQKGAEHAAKTSALEAESSESDLPHPPIVP